MATERFEGLYVSVSQIKTYLSCPRKYELRYVRGDPTAFVPAALAFGTAIHRGLAFFYGEIGTSGKAPPLESVVQVFVEAWEAEKSGPRPLQDDDEIGGMNAADKGVEMLAAFYRHVTAGPLPDVEAVEKSFAVALHDPDTGEILEEQLVGTIDLLIREGARLVICEHKTSARKYSNDQLRNDIQLTAYQLAARELGLGEVGLRFQVITKTKLPAVQVETVERDEQDADDFLRTAVGVLRAIEARAFFPVRGWQCKSCPFAEACRGARR